MARDAGTEPAEHGRRNPMTEKPKITRVSADDPRIGKGSTDWDALRAAGDYEGEPGEDEFDLDWSKARLVAPGKMSDDDLDKTIEALRRIGENGFPSWADDAAEAITTLRAAIAAWEGRGNEKA
jgi:hypothetical protein